MLNGAEGSHRHQQPLSGSTAHDAVLVLDPSPGENFGHPVVLFYVDVNVTKKRCSHLDGIYLGESAHFDIDFYSVQIMFGTLVKLDCQFGSACASGSITAQWCCSRGPGNGV